MNRLRSTHRLTRTGTPLPAIESRIRRYDMTRKKGNADLSGFRTGPSGTTLERINSSFRHHLAGGSRHSLRGRSYPREPGCQTRSVGILEHFFSSCLMRPESSRIRPVRLFCYENHSTRRVKKLSSKECLLRLDRRLELAGSCRALLAAWIVAAFRSSGESAYKTALSQSELREHSFPPRRK